MFKPLYSKETKRLRANAAWILLANIMMKKRVQDFLEIYQNKLKENKV